jgi:hypothetical protein
MIAGLRSAFASSFLSLFTSGGTLICCALPALMVSLGAGAAMAGLVGAFPQLIWLSEHKTPLFIAAAVMLAVAGLMQWHARRLPCPADPKLAAACTRTRRLSMWTYGVSVAVFAVGVLFAYVLPLLNDA